MRVKHVVSIALVATACGGGQQDTKAKSPPPNVAESAKAGVPAAPAREAAGKVIAPAPLTTDEGMWLLNDFPSERLKDLHGFAPPREWLGHVQRSAVRLAGGCSGSFVSARGLVMTNHHCAETCIQQLSTARKDFVASGFYARAEKDEVKCPEMEINQLVEISDVTARVNALTAGLEGARYNEVHKAELSKIEKECATSDDVRCDVVSLYHGGLYHLYKYQRYQDVRLVFAPEFAAAFFGGDPDNFMFPRYDLDVSFLRVYKDQKPLVPAHFFKWSPAGVKEGDLTFVAGHPWGTSREYTVAELEYVRDVALPVRLLRLAESRGMLTEFRTRGAEQKRISSSTIFGIENSLKAIKGRAFALRDREVFAAKVAAEQDLKAKVFADPAMKQAYGGAWDAIASAQARLRNMRVPYQMLEQGVGFWSSLFGHAKNLVRASDELPKPNEQRLREYADSQLPAVRQMTLSTAPIYDELEILTLTHSLTELREELGPDHPIVKKVLGLSSPNELATRLIKTTKLKDVKVRKALFDGGKASVDASRDPMIELARLIEPDARALRKTYEDDVEAVVKKNSELVARARFQIYGTGVYPDATASLRLSFGQVKGWDEGGKQVDPLTRMGGAFDRATGRDPFALPKSWLDKKVAVDLSTPLNFASTNDIIGGNSGSPVIDREGRVVGLVFDGNIHSLGGDYAYDPKNNRAVAVHSAALLESLDKIYGASRIVSEIAPR
ncbi:MAG TPA: S46 family peptidase [Polyangiaceae bacterium]|nr:S46 family peptidase [Polyangiaceae bacterium]